MGLPTRVTCLAAAITLAAAAFPASVGADPSTCHPGAGPIGGDASTAGGVNVHITQNNSVMWCSAAVIEANSDIANGTNYPLRSTSQSPSANPVSNAISVSKLLTLAGLNPPTVNHTQLMRQSGSWSILETADLTDPSARFEGGLAPIFWINGSETQYLRPLRGPSDTNGNDAIVASNGSPLDVYVYSGPLLKVSGRATPSKAGIKQAVTFTARVSNRSPRDGALTYRWSFQDGATATGPTVTHRYVVAGAWYPVVTVQGAGNDSGGASPPIPVSVGATPVGAGAGKPGGGNPNRLSSPGGPVNSQGKTPNAAPTNNPSQSSGSQPSSHPQSPTSPGGSPSPSASRQPSTTPAPSSKRSKVKPAGVPRRRTGVSGHQRPLVRLAPEAPVVKGRLISALVPVSSVQLVQQDSPAQPVDQAHAPSARLGGGSVPPAAAIIGGCAIILLLGAGAGSELRSQTRPLMSTRVS